MSTTRNGQMTPKEVAERKAIANINRAVKNITTAKNSASSTPSNTDLRATENLANSLKAQAPKTKSVVGFLPMVVAMALAPTKAGDGTLKEGTVKKAKAEAARKAKRRPAK